MHQLPTDQFVPKIHPLDRGYAPEDPLELMGESIPGDPVVMLDCVIQEFAWMGYNAGQLMALFQNPGYPVLCRLREQLGEESVRRHVESLVADWGVLRFRETVVESDELAEPRLYQIERNGPLIRGV